MAPLSDRLAIVVCRAGHAVDPGTEGNLAIAVSCARRIVGDDFERAIHVIDQMGEYSTELVTCFQAAIGHVAQALLQAGRIDGDGAPVTGIADIEETL